MTSICPLDSPLRYTSAKISHNPRSLSRPLRAVAGRTGRPRRMAPTARRGHPNHSQKRGSSVRYTATTALPRPLHRVHAVWAMLVWITEPLRCTLRIHPYDHNGRCATCGRAR